MAYLELMLAVVPDKALLSPPLLPLPAVTEASDDHRQSRSLEALYKLLDSQVLCRKVACQCTSLE